MRVLAIDTALEACSVAVLDTAHADAYVQESLPMQRGHAEALMPLIERMLNRAELDVSAIDRIAVATGPGSFTGLRVGSMPFLRGGLKPPRVPPGRTITPITEHLILRAVTPDPLRSV
jgi:tRNA A37 threonylcarbamoyladenosine modification protein TsaB